MGPCKECKFWDRKEAVCHRNPPSDKGIMSMWIKTLPDDWCGEFQSDGQREHENRLRELEMMGKIPKRGDE